jgi:hypothetical protein
LTWEPARPIESDKDLKNELFSRRLEAEPRETLKPLTKPLVSELTMPIEPPRDLNAELFSAKLEA